MRHCVYNTSPRWIAFLKSHHIARNVNFWRKDSRRLHLTPGSWFYFKPLGTQTIAGRGRFREIVNLPVVDAWQRFGSGNGCASEAELREQIGATLHASGLARLSCIVLDDIEWLAEPFQFGPTFFPSEIMGGKFYAADDLQELESRFERASVVEDTPLVLVENEVVVEGSPSWSDATGELYHFPNIYRNRIKSGRRFVYYRGVRRVDGRGQAEYFGCGRIGDVWKDPADVAQPARRQRWFCGIEDYSAFRGPVPSRLNGQTFENIAKALGWRTGVREISESSFSAILRAASVTQFVSDPTEPPDQPPVIVSNLLRVRRPRTEPLAAKSPNHGRRSKDAARIGRKAEEIVYKYLCANQMNVIWRSKNGELPGYDLDYTVGETLQAVEVKGTVCANFGCIELTAGEWATAERLRGSYWLYLVANCNGSPEIEIIQDPFGLVDAAAASLYPLVFRFDRLR